MEALLAALGHDVVELDRLQVQRSECKVADKWKVELCHLAWLVVTFMVNIWIIYG